MERTLRSLLHIAEQRRNGAGLACEPRVGLTTALGLALLAVACASVAPKIDAPQVSLEAVRVTRIVASKAEISVRLRLVNPNASELVVNELNYEITLDGRQAASGRTTRVDPLPPGGEGTVELGGRVDVAAVATAMMALGSELPVAYTLKGTAALQNGVSLSFSRKGEIAVSRFDPAAGSRPR
jgi:LEA14-like dessication related protein